MFFGAGSSSPPNWWSVFSEKKRVLTTLTLPRNNFRFFRRSNLWRLKNKPRWKHRASEKANDHKTWASKRVAFWKGNLLYRNLRAHPPKNRRPYYCRIINHHHLLITPFMRPYFLRDILEGHPSTTMKQPGYTRLEHQISAT